MYLIIVLLLYDYFEYLEFQKSLKISFYLICKIPLFY